MFKWLKESNRNYHFLLAIPFGLFFTMLCVLGLAIGMEVKDVQLGNYGKDIKEWDWKYWDWLDFLATILGGFVGQIILSLILVIIT